MFSLEREKERDYPSFDRQMRSVMIGVMRVGGVPLLIALYFGSTKRALWSSTEKDTAKIAI